MENLFAVAIFNHFDDKNTLSLIPAKDEREALEEASILQCTSDESKQQQRDLLNSLKELTLDELMDNLRDCELSVSSIIKIN